LYLPSCDWRYASFSSCAENCLGESGKEDYGLRRTCKRRYYGQYDSAGNQRESRMSKWVVLPSPFIFRFILDGFPRTVPQAEKLDSMLDSKNTKLDHAVGIGSHETLMRRITNSGCVARVTYYWTFNPSGFGTDIPSHQSSPQSTHERRCHRRTPHPTQRRQCRYAQETIGELSQSDESCGRLLQEEGYVLP
jgi:hypothetical protein